MTTVLERIISTWIRGQNRILIWILLIVLTLLILLYPVHLANEYHSIQAPYLFDNLWLFGTLFCVWMLLLFLILFSKRDNERLRWESLALACIFGIGFIGFWVFITPYGKYSVDIYNLGHVAYLVEYTRIPVGHPNLGYFDFPGMHLLVTALSLISGLEVFESRIAFLVFNAILFSALLYVLFVKTLKSNRLAFVGLLLVVVGSAAIVDDISMFYPRAFGFTLLAGLLLMVHRSEKAPSGMGMSDRLMKLILFAAMAISYFATSFLAPLVLLAIYVLQLIGKEKTATTTLTSITLFFVIVLVWEMYWTWHIFNSLIGFFPKLGKDLLTGEFLRSALVFGPANIGAKLPLWATITRFFWWGLLLMGTLIGLSRLAKVKNLSSAEKIEVGGLLGVILLTAFGLFGTERGSQFARFLLYAPIFCAPILLRFLSRMGKKVPTILSVLLFIMALPSFLSSVNTISTDAIYPYELTCGELLESHTNKQGKNIVLYSASDVTRTWAYYYIPEVTFRGVSERAYYSEDELWQEVNRLITSFQNIQYSDGQLRLFVISEKTFWPYLHALNITRNHPKWQESIHKLSYTDIIYANGHATLYAR